MTHFSILYGAAQSNTRVISIKPNERITLRRLAITCDNANSVDVGGVIGFGGDVLLYPFAGHPGIAAGSGFVEVYPDGLLEGGLGQHLLFTCEVPTGGGIRVSGSCIIHEFD